MPQQAQQAAESLSTIPFPQFADATQLSKPVIQHIDTTAKNLMSRTEASTGTTQLTTAGRMLAGIARAE